MSPFFPALYPRDYATQHAIRCDTGNNATNFCRIRVIFTDFQIALDSTIEVLTMQQSKLNSFEIYRSSKTLMANKLMCSLDPFFGHQL